MMHVREVYKITKSALKSKWRWSAEVSDYTQRKNFLIHVLRSKECTIEIHPRQPYCDRCKWEIYALDEGYPTNPNPLDGSDFFPRHFFNLERAKLEMEDWMEERKYTPIEADDSGKDEHT